MIILQVAVQADATLAKQAVDAGLTLQHVADTTAALEAASSQQVGLVFFDIAQDFAAFQKALKEQKLTIPVIAYGPATPPQPGVKAIRLGAAEYLTTPLDGSQIGTLMDSVKEQQAAAKSSAGGPIAADPKTKALLEQAQRFAESNATILLRGESGVGKDVFAKFIHSRSPRVDKQMISVNCAAIPEQLLESELFGHEKGAFSGAVQKRLGKFQLADKSTLFLDEIGEMDAALQAKLLRAIQERVIDPVGSSSPVPVDIRLIAATNQNLENYVAEGKFREDLYFRLNVVTLDIPPLRERPEDIIPLAEHFVALYSSHNAIDPLPLTDAAQAKLRDCYWKGNVRELENTMHRAVLMALGAKKIDADDVVLSPMSLAKMAGMEEAEAPAQPAAQPAQQVNPAAAAYASAGGGFSQGTGAAHVSPLVGKSLAEVEQELILNTLDYYRGDQEFTARILGLTIRQLAEKLEKYSQK